MTDLDRETRAAVDALVSRYRSKGDADDEPWAEEFVAFLKTLGWRPVLAVPASADWRRRPAGGGAGAGLDPDVKAELLGRFQSASDAIRHGTGGQPALTEDRERELLREGPDP